MSSDKRNEERTFTLRGNQYTLTRDEVERSVINLAPKQGEKYFIKIGDRRYPPKQILAESLRLSPMAFTTLDANRILRKLGFEIVSISGSWDHPSCASTNGSYEEMKARLDDIEKRFDQLERMFRLEKRIAAIEAKVEAI
jgi:hypothetical protein